MIMTMAAGGMTQLPSLEEIIYYQDRMSLVKEFNETVMFNDLLAVAGAYKDLANYGQGCGNYLTWGVMDEKSQDPYDRLLPRGGIFDRHAQGRQGRPQGRPHLHQVLVLPGRRGYGQDAARRGTDASAVHRVAAARRARSSRPASTTGPARLATPTRRPRTCRWRSGRWRASWSPTSTARRTSSSTSIRCSRRSAPPASPRCSMSSLGRIAARVIKALVITDYALEWSAQLLANMKAGDNTHLHRPAQPDRRRQRRERTRRAARCALALLRDEGRQRLSLRSGPGLQLELRTARRRWRARPGRAGAHRHARSAIRSSRSRSCAPSTPSILEWLVRFT